MSRDIAGLVQNFPTVPSHGSTMLARLGGSVGSTGLGMKEEHFWGGRTEFWQTDTQLKQNFPCLKATWCPRVTEVEHAVGSWCHFSSYSWKKLNKLMVGQPVMGMVLSKTPPPSNSDLQPGVFLNAFSMRQPFLFSNSWDVCHTAGDATSPVLHRGERGRQTLWTFISLWVKNHLFAAFLPSKMRIWWMYSEISHPLFTTQDYFGVQKDFQTSGRTSFSTVWKTFAYLFI